jgi:hypothetical protein
LAALDRATAAVEQYGERFFEAEIGRIRQTLVNDAG